MKFINKLERKWGKHAITNLSLYLIICYGFGYLMQAVNESFVTFLTLNPFLIIKGQVWRIFTWILVPPDSSNILFVLIMLYFYYSIGTTLERTWGAFRYNLYIFSGMLFTVLGSFLLMGVMLLMNGFEVPYALAVGGDYYYILNNGTQFWFGLFSTYYINMSIFLAFAATYPNMQILLMFIIPIKVKWLGIVYGAFLIFSAFQGGLTIWFVIGASLLNFIVFFIFNRKGNRPSIKHMQRQHAYKREVKQASGVTRHKCAICGRTEQDSPELEFRFCSKCDGNYEYCQEHLFTHQHVTRH